MLNLEERITRVHHREVRPLVAEAYRCHSTGTPRAAIVLTWTAVCTDLIHKLYQLAEDGEGVAQSVVKQIDTARSKGVGDTEAVQTMQRVENGLLQNALALDLIDSTEHRQLERLQEDRNLCAHPSMRALGEVFTPSSEYARAHLVTALDALLVHPPSQGRKAVDRFCAYAADPSFVGGADLLVQTYAERVKPSTRRQIFGVAAKHAMLELAVPEWVGLGADVFADRMARCLKIFAQQYRALVEESVTAAVERLSRLPVELQVRAVVRLGELDVFSSALEEPVWRQINEYVEQAGPRFDSFGDISDWQASVLALAAVDDLRDRLPALMVKFVGLHPYQKAAVIHERPSGHFTPYLASILTGAGSWRAAEEVTQKAVLPCAPFITPDQLPDILTAWAENSQCRAAVDMPAAAVALWAASSQLWEHPAWAEFVRRVRELEPDKRFYQYEDLAMCIGYQQDAGTSG